MSKIAIRQQLIAWKLWLHHNMYGLEAHCVEDVLENLDDNIQQALQCIKYLIEKYGNNCPYIKPNQTKITQELETSASALKYFMINNTNQFGLMNEFSKINEYLILLKDRIASIDELEIIDDFLRELHNNYGEIFA